MAPLSVWHPADDYFGTGRFELLVCFLRGERRSVMTRRKVSMAFVVVVLVAFTWISGAMAQNANGATPADPWPRPFKLKNADVLVYQPQVDSWESNMLNFRAVLSITPAGSKREVLGVIWA